jgi:hypothetical protein
VEPGEARAVLGLAADADARAVQRRFRELARTLHPDRGGDATAFAAAHTAYAVLLDVGDAPGPRAPREPARDVARGLPSRGPRPERSGAARGDAPDAGPDVARLRALVAAVVPGPSGARRLRLVSVAPGSRRNRFATVLPPGAVSVLEVRIPAVGAVDVGRGPDAGAAAVRLSARGRRARRAVAALALDRPELGGRWTRHRSDGAVELRAAVRAAPAGSGPDVAQVAEVAVALLGALGWPLTRWAAEAD